MESTTIFGGFDGNQSDRGDGVCPKENEMEPKAEADASVELHTDPLEEGEKAEGTNPLPDGNGESDPVQQYNVIECTRCSIQCKDFLLDKHIQYCRHFKKRFDEPLIECTYCPLHLVPEPEVYFHEKFKCSWRHANFKDLWWERVGESPSNSASNGNSVKGEEACTSKKEVPITITPVQFKVQPSNDTIGTNKPMQVVAPLLFNQPPIYCGRGRGVPIQNTTKTADMLAAIGKQKGRGRARITKSQI